MLEALEGVCASIVWAHGTPSHAPRTARDRSLASLVTALSPVLPLASAHSLSRTPLPSRWPANLRALVPQYFRPACRPFIRITTAHDDAYAAAVCRYVASMSFVCTGMHLSRALESSPDHEDQESRLGGRPRRLPRAEGTRMWTRLSSSPG